MDNDRFRHLNNVIGRVYHIESFGAVDGPGLRCVVFLQGCGLRCLYCHNPDSIPKAGGITWAADDLAREILRYKNFIRGGGVTFSGGEPLLQAEFVHAVSVLLHKHGLHVALDTAGWDLNESVVSAIDEADMLLLDVKAIDPVVCRTLTGRDNQYSFQTLDYCEKTGKPVWLRHVLVRGYTLDEPQLRQLAERLRSYRCIERIELLPFHKLGEPKWEAMDWKYTLADTPATTKKELEWAKQIFRENGFTVQ